MGVKLSSIYTFHYKYLRGKRYQNKYCWGHLDCSAGKYGNNCLQNCSEKCYIAKTCDRKTGVCHRGCTVGWNLPFCNEGTCIFLKGASTICSWLLSFYYDFILTLISLNISFSINFQICLIFTLLLIYLISNLWIICLRLSTFWLVKATKKNPNPTQKELEKFCKKLQINM